MFLKNVWVLGQNGETQEFRGIYQAWAFIASTSKNLNVRKMEMLGELRFSQGRFVFSHAIF